MRQLTKMKERKSPPENPDDIDLHPDAWDRFVDAVKRVARHPPVPKPKPKSPKRRSVSHKRER